MDIRELFSEFYSPLCNYASKIVGDYTNGEDIVQSLFIQLWENKKILSIEQPEKYLLRSTKFKCIDYLRKKETFPEISEDTIADIESFESTDLTEQDIEPLVLYFAAKLPPQTREVFLLSRTSGLTYKEIAEEKNVSVKTVESHMGKALKTMRTLLKEHDFYAFLALLKITKDIF